MNHALGRGSLVFSENLETFVFIQNSTFINNFGNTGLLYSNFYSIFNVSNSSF